MPLPQHHAVTVRWTGDCGTGTTRYDDYSRSHDILVDGKPTIAASADAGFRGDPTLPNPEDLFVAALSSCHMLFYLALCARHGVCVHAYEDRAAGVLDSDTRGQGRFTGVRLSPRVTVAASNDLALARRLHDDAHRCCFLANSVSAPVDVIAQVDAETDTAEAIP